MLMDFLYRPHICAFAPRVEVNRKQPKLGSKAVWYDADTMEPLYRSHREFRWDYNTANYWGA